MAKSSGGTRAASGGGSPAVPQKTYTEEQYQKALDNARVYVDTRNGADVFSAKEKYDYIKSTQTLLREYDGSMRVSSLEVTSSGDLTTKGIIDVKMSDSYIPDLAVVSVRNHMFHVSYRGDVRGEISFDTYSLKNIKEQVNYERSMRFSNRNNRPQNNDLFDDMHNTWGRNGAVPREYRKDFDRVWTVMNRLLEKTKK